MATTHDIDALMAAIDAGDELALPILADALEEAGDGRARGVRTLAVGIGEGQYLPDPWPSGWRWYRYAVRRVGQTWHALAPIAWDAMADAERWERSGSDTGGDYLEYRTLSDAVMAFAEAVADDRP